MRSVHFNEEHETFRQGVRRFLDGEVAPHAAEWEAARRIPREIFVRMGELGYLGITAPERYGGSEADLFFAVAFLEELPRSLMGGFCAAVSVQQFMATPHILRAGSEELKQRYLAPSVAGRKVGALAITEPDAGSDVAAVRTAAVRDGDVYVVNGAKTFITNGAEGDFFTTAVRTGNEPGAAGISLLVIDADTDGVTVASRLEKLGWHSSDTAELAFADARVPAANLIGDENSGFYQIMESFALERMCSAAIAVGSADVALEHTLRHMAARRAFGRPLNRFQALRHRLADLQAELEAARHLTYHTAWRVEQGDPALHEAAMAKLIATELGKRVADECLQFFGGYGFTEEYLAARFYRDARGATITAGTSEIMREIVARWMIDAAEEAGTGPATTPTTPPGRSTATVEAAGSGGAAARSTPRVAEELVRELPRRLRPERVEGWSARFHLVVRDAGRSEWTVRVHEGQCEVDEGLHGSADCIVRLREKTLRGLLDGSVGAQGAFLTGKIKVSAMAPMMRFVRAFRFGA